VVSEGMLSLISWWTHCCGSSWTLMDMGGSMELARYVVDAVVLEGGI
jgi:hypothetical protein